MVSAVKIHGKEYNKLSQLINYPLNVINHNFPGAQI